MLPPPTTGTGRRLRRRVHGAGEGGVVQREGRFGRRIRRGKHRSPASRSPPSPSTSAVCTLPFQPSSHTPQPWILVFKDLCSLSSDSCGHRRPFHNVLDVILYCALICTAWLLHHAVLISEKNCNVRTYR